MTQSFKPIKNVRLAPLTTLRIGGNARYFVRAETDAQVVEAVEFAKRDGLELFVLGRGSNVLISDRGFDGLVLQVALRGISSSGAGADGRVELTAQAGEDWDSFVAYCVERDLAGVECLSGIPGFVGGTPVQNVGAYGQEVSETIISVRCYDRTTKEFVLLTNADCGFSYRTSIFNTTQRDRYIVLSVTFALKRHGEPKIIYKDLIELFSGRRPTLVETRNAVLKIRRAKSMVIDPNDVNSRSAGSFFKNPIVSRKKHAEIANSASYVPCFNVDESSVKIPAAWLIEHAGFHKGYKKGNVGLSTRHILALTNCGNGTAKEILTLKDEIQRKVKEKFGIELVPEPVFIGF